MGKHDPGACDAAVADPIELTGSFGMGACHSRPGGGALSTVTVMGKAASIRDRMEASSTEDCCNQDDPEQQQPKPPWEIEDGQSQQCHGDAFRVLGRFLPG
jgi:hypothetical protein